MVHVYKVVVVVVVVEWYISLRIVKNVFDMIININTTIESMLRLVHDAILDQFDLYSNIQNIDFTFHS